MLTGAQVSWLANEVDQSWSADKLAVFVHEELEIDFSKLAPGQDLKQRVVELFKVLTRDLPMRDGELLEKLEIAGNQRLRNAARKLLQPSYFSPTTDPHDAILLGEEAFVDRGELRKKLRKFTNPSPYTTRVLIIRGEEPCGKSYSWSFLRHLAWSSVGAKAVHVPLADGDYKHPRDLVEQTFFMLDLDLDVLPAMPDQPQQARIDPLIGALYGQIGKLPERRWLVIDDINDQAVTPEIRETAYAIAKCVEDNRPENLWVALLGYNEEILDNKLRKVVVEDVRFFDAELLAQHFQWIAGASGNPLSPAEAREYADLIFAKYPVLAKEAMISMTRDIETMGERLKAGERP